MRKPSESVCSPETSGPTPASVQVVACAPFHVPSAWIIRHARTKIPALASIRVLVTAAREAGSRPSWSDDPPVRIPCRLATVQAYNLLDGFAVIEEAARSLAGILLSTEPSPPLPEAMAAEDRLSRLFQRVLQVARLTIHHSVSVQHLGWIAQDSALAQHVLTRAARHRGWPLESATHPAAGAWPWEELSAYLAPVLLRWQRQTPEDVPAASWRQALDAARAGGAVHLVLADDLMDGRVGAQVAVRLLVGATAAWAARTALEGGGGIPAMSVEPAGILTRRWSPTPTSAPLSLIGRWHGIGVPHWANGGCWAWRTVPFPVHPRALAEGDARPSTGPGLFYAERIGGQWRCIRSRRRLPQRSAGGQTPTAPPLE